MYWGAAASIPRGIGRSSRQWMQQAKQPSFSHTPLSPHLLRPNGKYNKLRASCPMIPCLVPTACSVPWWILMWPFCPLHGPSTC